MQSTRWNSGEIDSIDGGSINHGHRSTSRKRRPTRETTEWPRQPPRKHASRHGKRQEYQSLSKSKETEYLPVSASEVPADESFVKVEPAILSSVDSAVTVERDVDASQVAVYYELETETTTANEEILNLLEYAMNEYLSSILFENDFASHDGEGGDHRRHRETQDFDLHSMHDTSRYHGAVGIGLKNPNNGASMDDTVCTQVPRGKSNACFVVEGELTSTTSDEHFGNALNRLRERIEKDAFVDVHEAIVRLSYLEKSPFHETSLVARRLDKKLKMNPVLFAGLIALAVSVIFAVIFFVLVYMQWKNEQQIPESQVQNDLNALFPEQIT